MLEQRIQQQFFEAADLQYQAAEVLGRSVARAAQALVAALTAGSRVFVAGLGRTAALAQWFAADLVGPFERERPALAAIALCGEAVGPSASAGAQEPVLARQVEALGHPGDVLVLIEACVGQPGLAATLRAARSADMTLVVLTGRDGGALGAALGETDVLIAVPHERAARAFEAQLLVLNALADAIDFQLLGEQEAT